MIRNYIGAIASVISKKNKKVATHHIDNQHPIHTCSKEQHLNWVEQGRCQCCGGESGEYKGICDSCRLS